MELHDYESIIELLSRIIVAVERNAILPPLISGIITAIVAGSIGVWSSWWLFNRQGKKEILDKNFDALNEIEIFCNVAIDNIGVQKENLVGLRDGVSLARAGNALPVVFSLPKPFEIPSDQIQNIIDVPFKNEVLTLTRNVWAFNRDVENISYLYNIGFKMLGDLQNRVLQDANLLEMYQNTFAGFDNEIQNVVNGDGDDKPGLLENSDRIIAEAEAVHKKCAELKTTQAPAALKKIRESA